MKADRRPALARLTDAALVVALLIAVVLAVLTLVRIQRHLSSARAALGQLENTLSASPEALVQILADPAQVSALQKTLKGLDADLTALEKVARPFLPLSPYLGWLPNIGGDIEAAAHLLVMARGTSEAARTLLTAFAPLVQRLDQTEPGAGSLGPELVQGLDEARPLIESAQASFAQAAAARDRIDAARLSPRTQALVERFDQYRPLLHTGLPALLVLPRLLGAEGPRTYLVLAQNNHELRATGGFISGVGWVQLDAGQVTQIRFQDSYTVDDLEQPHPPAPDPLRQLMGADLLLLRDANWRPNFATSAQVAAQIYRQDQGQAVDGVLAVDLTTLQLLLQATGPLQVPGYDQMVSSDNLLSMLMTYWQAPLLTTPGKEGSDWWLHRKDLAADLMAQLLPRLAAETGAADLPLLAKVLGQALQQRHLLIYVNDTSAQAILDEVGWSGNLRPTSGDYLLVVDSNVGFNKANANVAQTIDYSVELDEAGAATSQLVLSYRHLVQRPTPACRHESYYGAGYADLMERCYWDYVRVYLPEGTEVLDVEGSDGPVEVYQESSRTVVATSFLLENGQARQIRLSYRPGFEPQPGGYSLLVQKQAGTAANPLRVTIVPPWGATPTAASPLDLVWLGDRLVWQGDLATDREIRFSWK